MGGNTRDSDGRRRVAAVLLDASRFGHAQWFFGNLYEAVVRVPHRLASEQRDRNGTASPLGQGSPLRYYVPAVPATFPAAAAALISGWSDREIRLWLVGGAVCSLSGAAATAYLVRTVNMKLFFGDQRLAVDERERLLRQWYRLNAVRLVASGGAWLAARTARSRLTSAG
jgi:hypothetical protein